MAEPIITTNLRDVAIEVRGRLRALQGQVTRATRNTLRAHGERWRSAMIERFQPWSPGFRHSEDSPIRIRSGALRRSLSVRMSGTTLDDMRLTESAGGSEAAPHAALQEFGGTITPKAGKWLAIPMEGALTGSGQPERGYESPRNVPDLFFFQTNRDVALNRAWLVRSEDWQRGPTALESEIPRASRSKRAEPKLEFLYMLVKSVTVPPRLGMRDTEAKLAPQRLDDFWNWLRRELATPFDEHDTGRAAPASEDSGDEDVG